MEAIIKTINEEYDDLVKGRGPDLKPRLKRNKGSIKTREDHAKEYEKRKIYRKRLREGKKPEFNPYRY